MNTIAIFLQQTINGIGLGGIYALMGLGYTLIFGVLNVFSFAQGAIGMVGAYFTMIAVSDLQIGLFPAFILGVLGGCIVGFLVDRIAVNPFVGNPDAPVITTIGVGYILEGLVQKFRTPRPLPFPIPFAGQNYNLLGIRFTAVNLLTIGVGLSIMVILQFLVMRTAFGKSIRAVAESPTVAKILGVNTGAVALVTFIIASGSAGVAAILASFNTGVINPFIGGALGLKGIVVLIVAGVGNLRGAFFTGILLGLSEVLVSAYISSGYRDFVSYILMIAVLLIKPSGLFGELGRLERDV